MKPKRASFATTSTPRLFVWLLVASVVLAGCALLEPAPAPAPAENPTSPLPTAPPPTAPPPTKPPPPPTAPPPTAPPPTPTPLTLEGATVVNGGNLRSEPRIAPETVLAQVCPGDTLGIYERQEIEGVTWLRVVVVTITGDCTPTRAARSTEGWLSDLLVQPGGSVVFNPAAPPEAAPAAPPEAAPAAPAPVPVPVSPTPTPAATPDLPPATVVPPTQFRLRELERIALEDWQRYDYLDTLVFSPSRQWVIGSGQGDGDDGPPVIWNVADGSLNRVLDCNGEQLFNARVSPDGTRAAALLADLRVVFWNLSGTTVCTIPPLPVNLNALSNVEFVTFSPTGQLMVSTARNYFIIWQLANDTPLHILGDPTREYNFNPPVFSPDGTLLAVVNDAEEQETTELWRVSDATQLATLAVNGRAMIFSSDSQRLYTADPFQGVQVWQVSDGTLLQTIDDKEGLVGGLALSPDDQILARIAVFDTRFYRLSDGALLYSLEAYPDDLAFLPDGSVLTVSSDDGTLTRYNNQFGGFQATMREADGLYTSATSNDLIARLCPGDQLRVTRRVGDWLEAQVIGLAATCGDPRPAPGATGWVRARLVDENP